jgi:hypothetical protein
MADDKRRLNRHKTVMVFIMIWSYFPSSEILKKYLPCISMSERTPAPPQKTRSFVRKINLYKILCVK